MNIAVYGVVPLHKRRSALRIIEEMQLFRALCAAFIHGSLGHMRNQLTVEGIFGDFQSAVFGHDFRRSHAVVIVDEVDLSGLHIAVEGRRGGDRAGEAVVHGQRAVGEGESLCVWQLLRETTSQLCQNHQMHKSIIS